jgi:hypothetical protein
MDPISNVDRLVLLLRQRLSERAKSEKSGSSDASRLSHDPKGMDAVQALAAVENLDQRQFKRALIQTLLAENFGSALINDAKFQQIVDRVTDTVGSEPAAARLMDRAIAELKSPR